MILALKKTKKADIKQKQTFCESGTFSGSLIFFK